MSSRDFFLNLKINNRNERKNFKRKCFLFYVFWDWTFIRSFSVIQKIFLLLFSLNKSTKNTELNFFVFLHSNWIQIKCCCFFNESEINRERAKNRDYFLYEHQHCRFVLCIFSVCNNVTVMAKMYLDIQFFFVGKALNFMYCVVLNCSFFVYLNMSLQYWVASNFR